MGIKEIAVGAAVTLAVTFAAGIAVWYYTEWRSSNYKNPLVYEVSHTESFRSENKSIGTAEIKVSNLGNLSIKGVAIAIEFPKDIIITDKSIKSRNKDIIPIEYKISAQNEVKINILSMNPDESITFSFLLTGGKDFLPLVEVRSENYSGIQRTENYEGKNTSQLLPIVLVIFVALILQAFLMYKTRDYIRGFSSSNASVNNIAFLLIHRGFPEKAKNILDSMMMRKGFSVYELSNYALATGLLGDIDHATSLFAAAKWWASSKHQRAVLHFNIASLEASRGRTSEAISELSAAINLSRREVKKYTEMSIYTIDISKDKNIIDVMELK